MCIRDSNTICDRPRPKGWGFCKSFTEAFVRSTTTALSQRLTEPTATDATLGETPYQKHCDTKVSLRKVWYTISKGIQHYLSFPTVYVELRLRIVRFRTLHYRNAITSYVTKASIATTLVVLYLIYKVFSTQSNTEGHAYIAALNHGVLAWRTDNIS